MRILMVNEKCGYFGGVEQNVADAARLRQSGHVCTLAWGAPTDRNAGGYRDLFDDTAPCAELGARDGQPFDALITRWDPHVVYFHKVPQIKALLNPLGGRFAVRMVHDHDLCCPRGHKYFLLGGRICAHAAGWRCFTDGAFLGRGPQGIRLIDITAHRREMRDNFGMDRFIVASRFMQAELVQNGFQPDRIDVLPPAVRLPSSAPTRLPGSGRVLYVGQLVRGKGVDLLLAAMKTLKRDWTLDVVGAGNALPSLQRACQHSALRSRVRFHGWISPDSLASLYAQSDVVAVPSRWPEPFGMVGPQAMLAGRPVVAFDVGGICEWLRDGETGFLVAPQDVDKFGMTVQRLLDDTPLASRLGRRAFEVATERFSLDAYLRRLESLLTPIMIEPCE